MTGLPLDLGINHQQFTRNMSLALAKTESVPESFKVTEESDRSLTPPLS